MTVYANLVDNEVRGVYDLLPSTWEGIEDFDKRCLVDELFMQQHNFVKIVRDNTSYNTDTHRMSDFPWYTVDNGQVVEHRDILEITIPTRDDLLPSVRYERDMRMKDFEWRYVRYERQTRLGLPTTDNIEALDKHMQDLADITLTEDLNNIVWPIYSE